MHFPVLLDLAEKLDEVSCPTSIFYLEYTLAPHGKHPTQLREAVGAYNYLVDEMRIDPSLIIIGGDSAGGNLSLQLLRHMIEPHPDIALCSPRPPSKCILVSPWVSLDETSPSYTRNAGYDVLIKSSLQRWAHNWKGDHSDVFTDPIKAPYESWKNMLPSTFVVSGEQEILYDDIIELCENFKKVLLRNYFCHD